MPSGGNISGRANPPPGGNRALGRYVVADASLAGLPSYRQATISALCSRVSVAYAYRENRAGSEAGAARVPIRAQETASAKHQAAAGADKANARDCVACEAYVSSASAASWEDAGRKAVETAATSIRDLRVAEVVKMDTKVENGKVTAFRTRVALSFKYETS